MRHWAVEYLMRGFGRLFETSDPLAIQKAIRDESQTRQVDSAACVSNRDTRWIFDCPDLKPGWYMLEVAHTAGTIGSNLTLSVDQYDEHLLLNSKPVCKRIVRILNRTNRFTVRINSKGARLERLTLVGLSSRFARGRIRQRLHFKSNDTYPDAVDINCLYNRYREIFHRHYQPPEYQSDWLVGCGTCDDVPGRASLNQTAYTGAVKLLLVPVSTTRGSIDDSINETINCARQFGWDVQWLNEGQSLQPVDDRDTSEPRQYLMPVFDEVLYRSDALCRLLDSVTATSVLVYADHDYIDSEGRHWNPVLKPGWNPELLLAHDYIGLPWIVSADWLLRSGLESLDSVHSCNIALLSASLGAGCAGTADSCSSTAAAPTPAPAPAPTPTPTPTSTSDPASDPASDPGFGSEARVGSDVQVRSDENGTQNLLVPPLNASQVVHVPVVLAAIRDSGHSPDITSAVVRAGANRKSAVEHVLSQAQISARVVDGMLPNTTRVLWPIPDELPTVDIIIPTRDKVAVLKTCVDSILHRTEYSRYRIVLVDNGSVNESTQQYYDSLLDERRIQMMDFPGVFNYSAINNAAVKNSEADIVVLLNNDTEVISPEWLTELVRHAIRPAVGCVGAKLHYSNGSIQHGGVIVGITGIAGHAHRYQSRDSDGYCGRLKVSQNFSAVTAACMAVRRSTYNRVGGLDEDSLAVAWNDVDFCLKVQHIGLQNIWTPYAQLYHHEGLSRGADDNRQKINRAHDEFRVMKDRWVPDGYVDPSYHVGLTKNHEDFSPDCS